MSDKRFIRIVIEGVLHVLFLFGIIPFLISFYSDTAVLIGVILIVSWVLYVGLKVKHEVERRLKKPESVEKLGRG